MTAAAAPAVVPGPGLPTCTIKSSPRQGSSTNVSFSSAFRSSSPGRGVLFLSSAVRNPSFLCLRHCRRKRSSKTVLVVQGCSTFEVDEARQVQHPQVAQSLRSQAEPVVRGKVSWSADGKPTILWSSQKQRGKELSPNEEREARGQASHERETKATARLVAPHATHVATVGERKDFPVSNNRQSSAQLAEALPKEPSTPSKQHSEIFSPSYASRLLKGSLPIKQVPEPDDLRASFSPLDGAVPPSTPREDTQFQGGAHMHDASLREGDDRTGESVFTSKLEEILNDFKNRQQRQQRYLDRRAKKKYPKDTSMEEEISSPCSISDASRRESTLRDPSAWESSRGDHDSTNNGEVKDTSLEEEVSSPRSISDMSRRESTINGPSSRKSSRQCNDSTYRREEKETFMERDISSPCSIRDESRSKTTLDGSSSWKSFRRDHDSATRVKDTSLEREISLPGALGNVSRRRSTSNDPSSWKFSQQYYGSAYRGEVKDANSRGDVIEDHGKSSYENIGTSKWHQFGGTEADCEPLDAMKSRLSVPRKARKAHSVITKKHSSVRNRDSAPVEGHTPFKSECRVWVTDKKNLLTREIATETPDEYGENVDFRFQNSRYDTENFEEENCVNTASHNAPVERQPVNYMNTQNGLSCVPSELKGDIWVNDEESLGEENATNIPLKIVTNKQSQIQSSKLDKENFDGEGIVSSASDIATDAEKRGPHATHSKDSTGLQTGKQARSANRWKASWHDHANPSLPFAYQFSYSEAPDAPILRYREKPYSPFGPQTMQRPWTGGPPLKKSKKSQLIFDSFNPPPKNIKGVKHVQDPGPFSPGQGPKPSKSREEILGEPLTSEEIATLIDTCSTETRQLNLGRDGLTHNMLDLIHCHWKRRRVIRVRCLGVPTVDMDNVCFHLEDKTGGKIIYRSGGNMYLFRGRNYNYRDRPEIPLMLWKPIAPVYPRLIERAPEGLTVNEADQLRALGKKVEPLCRLNKNGVYCKLVDDVRAALKMDEIVRIDCSGLNPSDYKKIGAKLKVLVPCVLLSFDDEQILIWRGAKASMNSDSLNASSAAGLPEQSSVVDMGLTSMTDFADVDTDVTGTTDKTRHSYLIRDDFSPEEGCTEREFSADTDVYSSRHDVFPAQPEQAQDKYNLLFQDYHVGKEKDTAAVMMVGNTEGLPGDNWEEADDSTESTVFADGQERETSASERDFSLARSSHLDNLEELIAAGKQSAEMFIVLGVDELWDQAIASGIAVQLEDIELNNDNVVSRSRKLAREVPTGEVYTRKLMRSLCIKTPSIPLPNREVNKHLWRIKRMKLEKKLAKQQNYRIRRQYNPQDLAQDGYKNGGMHVDELAELLSMR